LPISLSLHLPQTVTHLDNHLEDVVLLLLGRSGSGGGANARSADGDDGLDVVAFRCSPSRKAANVSPQNTFGTDGIAMQSYLRSIACARSKVMRPKRGKGKEGRF
jgi:hypothetical protein